MKPACMDDAEFALWEQANNVNRPNLRAKRPCSDCPFEFYLESRAAGCCDGVPQMRQRGPMTERRMMRAVQYAERRAWVG